MPARNAIRAGIHPSLPRRPSSHASLPPASRRPLRRRPGTRPDSRADSPRPAPLRRLQRLPSLCRFASLNGTTEEIDRIENMEL